MGSTLISPRWLSQSRQKDVRNTDYTFGVWWFGSGDLTNPLGQ